MGWTGNRTIGLWEVSDQMMVTQRGERKWLCRCQCGTERFVLERSLRYGGSRSCGCLTRENAKKATAHSLEGRVFGDLHVMRRSESKHTNGGVWWDCKCSCGNLCEVPGTVLVTGKKTHCGCKTDKAYYSINITGRKFGYLTALYATDKRSNNGSVIWHCRCDCGNEIDVSYNELVYTSSKSCGCKKEEHDAKLHTFLTHIDGTSLEMIRSKKVPKNNTTGTRGVYCVKGKWLAKIVFQHKQYHLGKFDTEEEAKAARQEAEVLLFDRVVAHYSRWQTKANDNPEWANTHPIRILVNKKNTGGLEVVCLPILDECI